MSQRTNLSHVRAGQNVEASVMRLNSDLDSWAALLLDDLDSKHEQSVPGNQYEREKNVLDMHIHSARILITRPCLCRLERLTKDVSSSSSVIGQKMAQACIESANSIASLLPECSDSNVSRLYEATPWWSIVHIIFQSVVILVLELSYHTMPSTRDVQVALSPMKKLARWLRLLSAKNGQAKRGYEFIITLLRSAAMKMHLVSKHIILEIHLDLAKGRDTCRVIISYLTTPQDISDLLQEDDWMHARATSTAMSDDAAASCDTVAPHPRPSHHASSSLQSSESWIPTSASTPIAEQAPQADGDSGSFAGSYPDMFTLPYDAEDNGFPGLLFTRFDQENPFRILLAKAA